MNGDDEAYLLLLLSDGNLPTGAFVASAGLESYVTHGFFSAIATYEAEGRKKDDKLEYTIDFVRDSVSTYARSALPFVSDAYQVVQTQLVATPPQHLQAGDAVENALHDLKALDELYEVMTLNQVARRASKSQGVALLSLYTKGFSKPSVLRATYGKSDTSSSPGNEETRRVSRVDTLFSKLKLAVRREDTHGHLPVCWGVLTAALGLSLERSQFLQLFLYARGLISAGIRMNTLGPYAAQQLLLHAVRPIIDAETARCSYLSTGICQSLVRPKDIEDTQSLDDAWMEEGPAMTWPLGEILAARHDLQHSRIFNS